MNQIPNIEEVEWKDGMIVEFYAYEMHLNEGGGEEWDNELSIFQRGIVLGDEVVGCDHELSKSDFINGVYIDGIDAGGGYHADEYMKAVLVKPDWLITLEKTLHHQLQKAREEAVLKGERRRIIEQIRTEERQKARQDWLREEIVKLEKLNNTIFDLSDESFPTPWVKVKDVNEALQTIIDRYHSELDQEVSK